MKKLLAVALFCFVTPVFVGCEEKGGSIVENAEQSAIEAYEAAEAAQDEDAEMEAAMAKE